jgi:acid phosphatase type 7
MNRRILVAGIAAALIRAITPAAHADNIAAAGDISNPPGGFRGDVATAALLAPESGNSIGLVLPLGDNQYQCGELASFQAAYHQSWGRFLSITRPAPGNHEYITGSICQQANGTMRTMTVQEAAGAGYYRYFQDRSPAHPGYYSFDHQGWHFVVLNTTCTVVPGGCGGAQLAWLKADLAANRSKKCTVVYGHHPYMASAAPYPSQPDLKAIWPTLVLEDVDLYLAGHNHAYERLARIRTQGNIDEKWGPGDGGDGHAGVPTIVVGTGGSSLIPFSSVHPASRVRIPGRYGILKIVPDYPAKGRWIHAFKGTDGSTLDRVEMQCH